MVKMQFSCSFCGLERLATYYVYLVYILGYPVIMLLNALKSHRTWKCLILYNGLVSFSHKAQANILVFGGNGFIGSECVKSLLKDGHNLTLINRGNEYWDFAALIKPFVNAVQCDRNNGLHQCVDFVEKNGVKPYDFVIDFSAYHPGAIKNVFKAMKNKIGTYIYISSDSVYEVSEPSNNIWSKEEDAVRPASKEMMLKLNAMDSYGDGKLAGEEYLKSSYNTSHVPYVIFRLPDVIGPRDNTGRWWPYQAWFQYCSPFNVPLHFRPEFDKIETSYVYVKDVAEAIRSTINELSRGNRAAHNEVFNLGFSGKYTLRMLLNSMQEALGIKGVQYYHDEDSPHLFPSVWRGPVDISKAKKNLKWKPTPWTQAIQETVDFYKDAVYKFPRERNSMMNTLQMLISKDYYPLVTSKIEKDLATNMKTGENHPDHVEF